MTLSDRERDFAIRTVFGEAEAESTTGRIGVAYVIKNRLENHADFNAARRTVESVVTAPLQFEPWGNPERRSTILRLARNSETYQAIGRIVDAVFSGEIPDPTGGATMFANPEVVRARNGGGLGNHGWVGDPPSAVIGDHAFFGGDEASADAARMVYAHFETDAGGNLPSRPQAGTRSASLDLRDELIIWPDELDERLVSSGYAEQLFADTYTTKAGLPARRFETDEGRAVFVQNSPGNISVFLQSRDRDGNWVSNVRTETTDNGFSGRRVHYENGNRSVTAISAEDDGDWATLYGAWVGRNTGEEFLSDWIEFPSYEVVDDASMIDAVTRGEIQAFFYDKPALAALVAATDYPLVMMGAQAATLEDVQSRQARYQIADAGDTVIGEFTPRSIRSETLAANNTQNAGTGIPVS